ncbi:hypothetical protein EV178_001990 [Coemansia sp. RSA 1646]|nr:hypothetical protein EV178_001990 [Coemansia sp. RSA 1646]
MPVTYPPRPTTPEYPPRIVERIRKQRLSFVRYAAIITIVMNILFIAYFVWLLWSYIQNYKSDTRLKDEFEFKLNTTVFSAMIVLGSLFLVGAIFQFKQALNFLKSPLTTDAQIVLKFNGMDISHTATIGRSQRGLDTMRDLQAMLAQSNSDDTTTQQPETKAKRVENADEAVSTGSSSDVDDIDSETATNTIYNLLNELGDLNRSNRRTAEVLAEKFSTLQTRVSKAEDEAARGAEEHTCKSPVPVNGTIDRLKEQGDDASAVVASTSLHSDSAFHTPTNDTGQSLALPPEDIPTKEDAETQTTQGAAELDAAAERERKLDEENVMLRNNVHMLINSLKEQQMMAKEYESTLAKTLSALRSAAFERHLEISDVQGRYRELLESEKSLNERLRLENVDLKHALGNAAAAIRLSLASSETEAMMFETAADSTPSDDSDGSNRANNIR